MCIVEYGSCSLFKSHTIEVQELNTVHLRIDKPPPEIVGQENVNKFITPQSVIAVAAPKTSTDTIWFLKFVETNKMSVEKVVDDYQHEIFPGMVYNVGHFFEKNEKCSTYKKTVYHLAEKFTFFYKENILYPYVNLQDGKTGPFLSMEDYTDIIYYIENNGFSHL